MDQQDFTPPKEIFDSQAALYGYINNAIKDIKDQEAKIISTIRKQDPDSPLYYEVEQALKASKELVRKIQGLKRCKKLMKWAPPEVTKRINRLYDKEVELLCGAAGHFCEVSRNSMHVINPKRVSFMSRLKFAFYDARYILFGK